MEKVNENQIKGMDKQLLDEISRMQAKYLNQNQIFLKECEKLKEQGASKEVLDSATSALKITFDAYNTITADKIEYQQKYDQAVKARLDKSEKASKYQEDFNNFEKYLRAVYGVKENNKNKNGRKINTPSFIALLVALSLAMFSLGHWGLPAIQQYIEDKKEMTSEGDKDKDKTVKPTPSPSPSPNLTLGEPGTLLDITDDEQVIARGQWYFDNYFGKVFENLSDSKKERASQENLIDLIKIIHGKSMIYQDTNIEELNNYQNILGDMFCTFLSLEGDDWGFVPTQYLYLDGSVEQKAASQVDAVMEPLIKAMNEKNNELVVKYATEFGELMRKQFYLLNAENDNIIAVRGECSNTSKYHLWKLAYKQYTTKINEYCIANDLNICIDFCIDHNTRETVQISLSALMAMLEKIPMDNWDAILARAGITQKEVEKLGNKYSGMTISNIFISDARETMRNQMGLTLSK